MHKTLPASDFAAISCNIDEDITEPKRQEKVRKFLREQNATFTNLALDEKPDVWQMKLNFDGPPCVFVFNREGQVAKQFKDNFTYEDVEKLVKELLSQK